VQINHQFVGTTYCTYNGNNIWNEI